MRCQAKVTWGRGEENEESMKGQQRAGGLQGYQTTHDGERRQSKGLSNIATEHKGQPRATLLLGPTQPGVRNDPWRGALQGQHPAPPAQLLRAGCCDSGPCLREASPRQHLFFPALLCSLIINST